MQDVLYYEKDGTPVTVKMIEAGSSALYKLGLKATAQGLESIVDVNLESDDKAHRETIKEENKSVEKKERQFE